MRSNLAVGPKSHRLRNNLSVAMLCFILSDQLGNDEPDHAGIGHASIGLFGAGEGFSDVLRPVSVLQKKG